MLSFACSWSYMYHFQLSLDFFRALLALSCGSSDRNQLRVGCFTSMVTWCPVRTIQISVARPCSKTDGVCIVIRALGFAINLMAYFCTTGISKTIGSVRLYGPRGRAVCTVTWIYCKTISITLAQRWQHFLSHRMSHSIILSSGICCLYDPKRSPWHCASFFMVGNASVRSNTLSCTLKGMS